MTNPVRILNSVSPTVRPTGRSPGEPFVNYPDLQFGVVDVAGTAVDLLAVRFFSATAHYNIGDHVLQGGVLYRAIAATGPGAFAPASWTRGVTLADATATYLPLAGGTMTGLLLLSGDPAAALGAATKQMVDGKVAKTGDTMWDKLIISHGVVGRAQLLLYTPIGTPEGASPLLDLQNDIVPTANNGTPGVIRFWAKDSSGAVPAGAPIIQFIGIQSNIAPGAVSAKLFISTVNNGVNANRMVVGAGVYAPSLADMGNETLNFKEVYENGVRLVPPGVILPYAGFSAPAGWFLCNGQNISRAGNPNLAALWGGLTPAYPFGAGDGSTTMGVPDLRARVPVGVENMGGLGAPVPARTANGYAGNFATVLLGSVGGESAHQQTNAELSAHGHTLDMSAAAGANNQRVPYGTATTVGLVAAPITNAGGSTYANNTQPSIMVGYIIRGG